MLLTIVGGLIFLGSQAWEWKNFIKGEFGAIETKGGNILQFVKKGANGEYERVALADFAADIPTERQNIERSNGVWFQEGSAMPAYSVEEIQAGFEANPDILVRTEIINKDKQKTVLSREESLKSMENAALVVEGANLIRNEYGHKLFANFFFFITGFHGTHVFSGVVLNFVIFMNVIVGTYERRGHYEMVEKVGLYWHFVDLVWVFVFTFFYLL